MQGLTQSIDLNMSRRLSTLIMVAFTLIMTMAGCGPNWQASLTGPEGTPFLVDRGVLEGMEDLAVEVDGQVGVPLERVLWQAGCQVIDTIEVIEPEGARHAFTWSEIAADTLWLENGELYIDGALLPVSRLEIAADPLLDGVEVSITDLAPTAAHALGLPAPAQATGEALPVPAANHVLLLFLDGFGYLRHGEALAEDLIPNLAALEDPLLGLTVYPPCTSVASAALLTGASAQASGVDRRGIRKTEIETLFDVASAGGLQVAAVEGNALAFNLRSAQMQLSGDRDGNGSTDDNVLANSLAVLEKGMPELLFVHFHGIDDAGHTYGPGAPQEDAAIREVDAAVGKILEALPGNTLVIIFADHGMHAVQEEARQGNHGHLIARDMYIPVLITSK